MMSLLNKAFALAMLTAIPMTGYSCSGTWQGTDNIWNKVANWSTGCVPGILISNLDSATFDSLGTAFTVSIDFPAISPGLNELIINNSSSAYDIIGTFPNAIQFNGTSSSLQYNAGTQTISAPVQLSNTTLNIIASGGGTLTINDMTEAAVSSTSSIVASGSGTLFVGTEIMTNGSITLQSSNIMNKNTANVVVAATGTVVDAQGGITVNGGALSTINTGLIANGGAGAQTTTGVALVAVNGGVCNVTNNGAVSLSGFGAFMTAGNGMTIDGGIVSNINNGTIASGGEGAFITTQTALMMSSGTLSNSNTGPVSDSGSKGAFIASNDGITITGGTVTNTNTGFIDLAGLGASISSAGTLTMSSGTLSNLNSGTASGAGSIGSEIGAGSIIINGGTLTNTNTGSILGPSSIGSLIFVPVKIVVNGGVFTNNDTVRTPLLNVNAGGTLTGTGVFQDASGGSTTMVTNAGTVIPGGPVPGSAPGKMTIQGSYTQDPTGTLVINFMNPGSFSQLNVTGTAAVGGHLELGLSPGASVATGDTYKIVLGSSVTGTFADIVNFNLGPNLFPELQYFPTFVLLSFIAPPAPPITESVHRYINLFEPTFAHVNHINVRLGRQMGELRNRVSVAEEQAPVVEEGAPHVGRREMEGILMQLLADNSLTLPNIQEKQEQLKRTVASPNKPLPWNFYFGPTGDTGHVKTRNEAQGYNFTSAGALIGFDYAFSQVGLGLLFDYDHIHARGAHQWGKLTINEVHASLYATYAPKALPELALNGILGGGYESYRIRRNVEPAHKTSKGSPSGGEFDALLGLEYALEKKQFEEIPERLQIVPLISLQYVHLNAKKYHEHHAGIFELKFQSQAAKSLRSTLGTRINYNWAWANVVFTPEVNLGWQREFLDKGCRVHFTARNVVLPTSSLKMGRAGRNVGLCGLDFLVTLFDRYGIEASYDFEWNSLYRDHSFYLGANFRF